MPHPVETRQLVVRRVAVMRAGHPARKIVSRKIIDAANNISYERRSGKSIPQSIAMEAKQLPPSVFCICTILHSDKLEHFCRDGGIGKFTENKKCTATLALWERAENAHEQLRLMFAAAQSVSRLIYWAVITNLRPGLSTKPDSTPISFTGLKPIGGKPHLHSSLRLRSTRKQLSDNFIRTYAIWYTPSFLREQEKVH